MNEAPPQSGPRWYWSLPIILLIGILVPLGIRGFVKDDSRYSWGTFSKQIIYHVEYHWVMRDPDGSLWTTRHWHDDELRGEAAQHLESLPRRLNTRYSLGAVKSWMNAYTKYMYENRAEFIPQSPDVTTRSEVVGFTADVWYRVNESRRLRDRHFELMEAQGIAVSPKRQLFFSYPRGAMLPATESSESPSVGDPPSSSASGEAKEGDG
ncbi:MAG: hypothetical protein MI757_20960 [Pirellulales bacterium]|nr:hypothetical protein [Pirellulales bacterium]